MNEARFDDNGRVVHEKSRERTIADHVITRASFTESCHGLRDKAWSDIDSDTRVSIVRALLGAMSDEEQALLPMPLLAEEASEAYQSALGAVHGTEGQLAAIQSVACRYGYRDGSIAEFLDAKLEELAAAKQAVRGYYEPASLAFAINEIGESAAERELEAEKLRGMLTQARCQLENSERELAAAKEASHGYFEELTELAEAKHAVGGYYEPGAGLASAINGALSDATEVAFAMMAAKTAADTAAVRVGLYSSDAAGRHGYGYDEDGDLARFIERLASKYHMRDAMSRALEVTHPELGAPEWGQLLEVAADNAAIVRRVREAMRGTMGDE